MTVPNCEGCEYEYKTACDYVKKGFHIATCKDREFSGKGHLAILLVDDNGRIIIK